MFYTYSDLIINFSCHNSYITNINSSIHGLNIHYNDIENRLINKMDRCSIENNSIILNNMISKFIIIDIFHFIKKFLKVCIKKIKNNNDNIIIFSSMRTFFLRKFKQRHNIKSNNNDINNSILYYIDNYIINNNKSIYLSYKNCNIKLKTFDDILYNILKKEYLLDIDKIYTVNDILYIEFNNLNKQKIIDTLNNISLTPLIF